MSPRLRRQLTRLSCASLCGAGVVGSRGRTGERWVCSAELLSWHLQTEQDPGRPGTPGLALGCLAHTSDLEKLRNRPVVPTASCSKVSL